MTRLLYTKKVVLEQEFCCKWLNFVARSWTIIVHKNYASEVNCWIRHLSQRCLPKVQTIMLNLSLRLYFKTSIKKYPGEPIQ
jgi:hypothetical protein